LKKEKFVQHAGEYGDYLKERENGNPFGVIKLKSCKRDPV
jgi:hypothetical protein